MTFILLLINRKLFVLISQNKLNLDILASWSIIINIYKYCFYLKIMQTGKGIRSSRRTREETHHELLRNENQLL